MIWDEICDDIIPKWLKPTAILKNIYRFNDLPFFSRYSRIFQKWFVDISLLTVFIGWPCSEIWLPGGFSHLDPQWWPKIMMFHHSMTLEVKPTIKISPSPGIVDEINPYNKQNRLWWSSLFFSWSWGTSRDELNLRLPESKLSLSKGRFFFFRSSQVWKIASRQSTILP